MKKKSGREKKLVLLAGCAIIFFIIWQFALSPLINYNERIGKQIPKMKMDLLAARRLKKRYQSLDKDIQAIRARVDERREAFNPYDFLDKLARKEGIRSNLDKITSDSDDINDNYREDIVKIRLKDVALSKLVRYLYNIENSGQLLTVRELTIEPDSRDSNLLDVKFEVSTFARKEKEAD